jgi:hypothetical protein
VLGAADDWGDVAKRPRAVREEVTSAAAAAAPAVERVSSLAAVPAAAAPPEGILMRVFGDRGQSSEVGRAGIDRGGTHGAAQERRGVGGNGRRLERGVAAAAAADATTGAQKLPAATSRREVGAWTASTDTEACRGRGDAPVEAEGAAEAAAAARSGVGEADVLCHPRFLAQLPLLFPLLKREICGLREERGAAAAGPLQRAHPLPKVPLRRRRATASRVPHKSRGLARLRSGKCATVFGWCR